MTIEVSLETLHKKLKGTYAERYLTDDGKGVATSVLFDACNNYKTNELFFRR